MKIKASMWLDFATLAIYYCVCNDSGNIRFNTSNGYNFAEKINITIPGASVYAGTYNNNITIIGTIDCGLDIIEIGRIVIIDSYQPRTAKPGKKYENKRIKY
ncbi:MAG: hypothetical protein WC770_04275 [Phycisphaerae bacterium]